MLLVGYPDAVGLEQTMENLTLFSPLIEENEEWISKGYNGFTEYVCCLLNDIVYLYSLVYVSFLHKRLDIRQKS